MKLCTFEVATSIGRHWRLGAVIERGIVDLNFACAWHLQRKGEVRPYALANVLVPDSLIEFLRGERTATGFAVATVDSISAALSSGDVPSGLNGETLVYEPGRVWLKAPLPRPASFRNFDAFIGYVEPAAREGFDIPLYRESARMNIIGPGDDVLWPPMTQDVDFGIGLGAVIGRTGTNIRVDRAGEYIAGYTALNNISVRRSMASDLIPKSGSTKQTVLATAMGPVLVTPDEIPDPYTLQMQTRLNGETWSTGTTGAIRWRFEQLIEAVSRDEQLHPGDLIGLWIPDGRSGTDVGQEVKPGDMIELEIEKVGVVRNRVVRQG